MSARSEPQTEGGPDSDAARGDDPGAPVIEARGLARTFRTRKGTVEAVRGVDLTVRQGEIVGFLGPNGAGKTTTLRMLTTLLKPTAGDATVVGASVTSDPTAVRRRIGYVAQSGGTDPRCRVLEELVFQGDLYGIPRAETEQRARTLCGQLDLAGLEERQVESLSGGQKRRLDIALGLIHRPALVFLDEPTTGLDPQSRSNMWDHVRRLRDDLGTTVFLTTHYLEEADALCDRILVIDHGQIVAEGSPDELKRRISGDIVTIEIADDIEAAERLLKEHPGVLEVTAGGRTLRLTVEQGDTALVGLMRALDAAGVGIAAIQLARPSLDDVFLTLTGRSLREEDQAPAPTAAP